MAACCSLVETVALEVDHGVDLGVGEGVPERRHLVAAGFDGGRGALDGEPVRDPAEVRSGPSSPVDAVARGAAGAEDLCPDRALGGLGGGGRTGGGWSKGDHPAVVARRSDEHEAVPPVDDAVDDRRAGADRRRRRHLPDAGPVGGGERQQLVRRWCLPGPHRARLSPLRTRRRRYQPSNEACPSRGRGRRAWRRWSGSCWPGSRCSTPRRSSRRPGPPSPAPRPGSTRASASSPRRPPRSPGRGRGSPALSPAPTRSTPLAVHWFGPVPTSASSPPADLG